MRPYIYIFNKFLTKYFRVNMFFTMTNEKRNIVLLKFNITVFGFMNVLDTITKYVLQYYSIRNSSTNLVISWFLILRLKQLKSTLFR